MTKTWILVANAGKAKIFSVNKLKFLTGKARLETIQEFTHPASRKKDVEIASDKLGHYKDGSFVEPTDPKKYEAESFAREVIGTLEAARVANKFDELILVVPPQFRGMMNKYLRAPLEQVISKVIEKDYTKNVEKELEKHLQCFHCLLEC